MRKKRGGRTKANNMCIKNIKLKLCESNRTINGLMKHINDFNDAQAEAAVRDGIRSIEVLLMAYGIDGLLHTVSEGEDVDIAVADNAMPSNDEAKVIMRQNLRLPHIFSFSNQANPDATIAELENIRKHKLQEWTRSPIIGKELFLMLDKRKEHESLRDEDIL